MLFLLAGVAIFALLRGQSGGGDSERLPVPFAPDDAEMNQAMQDARDTFPEFLDALRNPAPAFNDFLVKVAFENEGGGEHIWLGSVSESDGILLGVVESEPINVPSITYGQPVIIDPDKISDWAYFDGDKRIGGFTIAVMEKHFRD